MIVFYSLLTIITIILNITFNTIFNGKTRRDKEGAGEMTSSDPWAPLHVNCFSVKDHGLTVDHAPDVRTSMSVSQFQVSRGGGGPRPIGTMLGLDKFNTYPVTNIARQATGEPPGTHYTILH